MLCLICISHTSKYLKNGVTYSSKLPSLIISRHFQNLLHHIHHRTSLIELPGVEHNYSQIKYKLKLIDIS